jgi:hypothetical protein
MTVDIATLRLQCEAALKRYHAVRTDFAKGLVGRYARSQLSAVAETNATLAKAGFSLKFGLCGNVESDNGTLKLECMLMPFVVGSTTVSFTLTDADCAAYKDTRTKADLVYDEYRELQKMLEAAEGEDNTPYTFDELLALVKEDHDEQEEQYRACGPRKHDQEDYTGVQVVRMNVDLLFGWLGDGAVELPELTVAQRRQLWEASGFHFGINGYSEADADHFWATQE